MAAGLYQICSVGIAIRVMVGTFRSGTAVGATAGVASIADGILGVLHSGTAFGALVGLYDTFAVRAEVSRGYSALRGFGQPWEWW